jgi:hypothetical protein
MSARSQSITARWRSTWLSDDTIRVVRVNRVRLLPHIPIPVNRLKSLGRSHRLQRGKAATELREAFGVRGACSRFRTAPSLTTAPASWTHSIRFAWQLIHKNLRSLGAYWSKAVQGCQDATISVAWHLHPLGEPFKPVFPSPSPCPLRPCLLAPLR